MAQDYVITFSGRTVDGRMSGSYQIETAGGRKTSQECKFGPGTVEQAVYLTLVTGLGDLLVRIQRGEADPFNFTVLAKSENEGILSSIADADPKVQKLHERALGMLKRFGRYELLDVQPIVV